MQQKNFHKIFDKYKYLAIHFAKRYQNEKVEFCDLTQAAFVGLFNGIIASKKEVTTTYLSKYILGEIIKTLRSYNDYKFSKDYFRVKKILEENTHLSVSEIVTNFNLSRNLVIDILVHEDRKPTLIEESFHCYFSIRQEAIYQLLVNKNYSVNKIANRLKLKKEIVVNELKEIYSIIKR